MYLFRRSWHHGNRPEASLPDSALVLTAGAPGPPLGGACILASLGEDAAPRTLGF